MNKTTIKIFLSFSFVSAIIATMLLVMNALGIGILITDTGIITLKHSPTSVLEDISLNLEKQTRDILLQTQIFRVNTGAFF